MAYSMPKDIYSVGISPKIRKMQILRKITLKFSLFHLYLNHLENSPSSPIEKSLSTNLFYLPAYNMLLDADSEKDHPQVFTFLPLNHLENSPSSPTDLFYLPTYY